MDRREDEPSSAASPADIVAWRELAPSPALAEFAFRSREPTADEPRAMRVIEEATIRATVKEADALEAAERAFRALAEDAVELPDPVGLRVPDVEGEVHIKAAHLRGSSILTVKVASGFYQNPDRGLPTGSGLILVIDATTGFPIGLLDDRGYLTELRTAAAGALAARHLAPDPLDVVGVLGSGTQARHQLRALAAVGRWGRTVAWSPNPEHVRAFCREMQLELGTDCAAADGPEAVARAADLLITVTPSRDPLIEAVWLRRRATVIAVGSDGPDKRELPTEALVRADKVVVDRLSQCLELGELHHAVAEGAMERGSVHAELGEIVVGRRPGREGEELIICDLTGVGAQDAAIAEIAWERLTVE